jgi:indole-3-glycerol phosphate synthase
MDRARWVAAKRDEIARLHGQRLSEVTPSRRDFTLYVSTRRREIAVIARVQRADPDTGGSWPQLDLVAHAVACDDAEVAAVAVATDDQRGGSLALLRSIAEATQAPLLRDDLVLHPSQLYDARLHGADAAIFPAADLVAGELAELARVASSLHMASVIEVQSPADLEVALALGRTLIGINADLEATGHLAPRVPAERTVLALRDPGTIDGARSLRGLVDAIVVGAVLLDSSDITGTLAALTA